MIKRTLDIAEGPSYLSCDEDQLVIRRAGQEVARCPCEDVGFLLIDHPAVTITQGLVARLMWHHAAVVFCGPTHLPAGLLLPVEANDLTGRRTRLQARCKLPVRKRLWKQIVRRKIALQAANLPPEHPVHRQLKQLAREVKSGDRTNTEGRAAAIYFPAIFGEAFRRDPEGDAPNSLLNYGYMVMRRPWPGPSCARASARPWACSTCTGTTPSPWPMTWSRCSDRLLTARCCGCSRRTPRA